MAKIGCAYPCFAAFNGTEPAAALPTYGSGINLGELVEANDTINNATGELYADNKKAETAAMFANGSLVIGLDDITYASEVVIFNSTLDGNELTDAVTDVAPYGGLAYYRKVQKDGAITYEGVFYPKVKASITGDSVSTQGSSIDFQTKSITFEILAPNVGDWRIRETLATEALAKAWVETKVSVATWYALTVAKSGTGTVSPLGTTYHAADADPEILISGAPTSIFDNGVDVTASLAAGKYTITNIAAAHEITVSYTDGE